MSPYWGNFVCMKWNVNMVLSYRYKIVFILVYLFSLCPQVQGESQLTLDSVFVRGSRPIIFLVNKSYIQTQDEQWINDSLKPALEALGENALILGRAAASPEGPYDNNVRLARERRQAADRILRRLGIDVSRIRYDVIPEDYEMLCLLMKQNHDEDFLLVDSLVRRHQGRPARLKQQLRSLRGGELWQRLLREYYPDLRAVRIMAVDRRTVLNGQVVQLHPLTFPLASEQDANRMLREPEQEFCPEPLTPYIYDEGERVHRIPFMAVRTNILYDLFYMPNYGFAPMWNVGLEFYPRRGHFTYGAWFMSPYYHRWSKNKFFQIRNYELEARYYFRGTKSATYKGLYVGLAADVNKYGIGLNKDKGWQGEGYGGQATVGYVMPVARHGQWKLHFTLGVGFYVTRYDPYVYGTPDAHGRIEDGKYYYDTDLFGSQFRERQHRYRWFGPTQLGVSISYDLLWRKGTRQDAPDGGGRSKGISFRRWE